MGEVNGFNWAANTLKAPRYMTILARLFGKRVTGTDGGFTAIGYHFRGKTYMVDFIAPAAAEIGKATASAGEGGDK